MSKKMTKKRNKSKLSRKEQRRQQERRATIAFGAFLGLCVAVFLGIGISNSMSGTKPAKEWIVQNAEMEILAAPAANTLNNGQAGGALPFMQATPQPTLVTLPTPAPTTAPTVPVMQPEQRYEIVPVTITAVGDCTLGGDVKNGGYQNFEEYVERYGLDYFFRNVRSLFENDDITIVNLEGPLTTSEDMRSGRTFNFRGDPAYARILSGSSVEIANVANNHALDFGDEGFNETAEVLKAEGIGVSGFSLAHLEEVNGVKVGSIGFTEWAYSESQIERAVKAAKEKCDLLIVSIHWGEERSYEATETQELLGRTIVDAGADLVVGHHSHVYGGVEQYKGKYIIYSLGNFCFGGNKNPSDKNCTIFQQTFNVNLSQGTVSDGGINIIPARISGLDDGNDFQPYILSGEAAQTMLNKINAVSNMEEAQVVWMKPQIGSVGAVALKNSF